MRSLIFFVAGFALLSPVNAQTPAPTRGPASTVQARLMKLQADAAAEADLAAKLAIAHKVKDDSLKAMHQALDSEFGAANRVEFAGRGPEVLPAPKESRKAGIGAERTPPRTLEPGRGAGSNAEGVAGLRKSVGQKAALPMPELLPMPKETLSAPVRLPVAFPGTFRAPAIGRLVQDAAALVVQRVVAVVPGKAADSARKAHGKRTESRAPTIDPVRAPELTRSPVLATTIDPLPSDVARLRILVPEGASLKLVVGMVRQELGGAPGMERVLAFRVRPGERLLRTLVVYVHGQVHAVDSVTIEGGRSVTADLRQERTYLYWAK